MDLLELYYHEHAEQARQHENQRERATALVVALAVLLTSIITAAKFPLHALPAASAMVALGAGGTLLARKHYERNRYHTQVMKVVREQLELISTVPTTPWRNLGTLRRQAADRHAAFSKASSTPQQYGRLHHYWEAINLSVAAIGVGMVIAIAIAYNKT